MREKEQFLKHFIEGMVREILVDRGKPRNLGPFTINLDSISEYIPTGIAEFDRMFNRVPKIYFHHYKPISVKEGHVIFQDVSEPKDMPR